MKTVKIIIIALLAIHCKAQTPIIDVIGTRMDQPDGYYVKDINNLLTTLSANTSQIVSFISGSATNVLQA